MQLDATSRKPGAATPLSKEKKEERRKKNLCFECGLPGHRAASCGKNKGKTPAKRTLCATTRVDSWTMGEPEDWEHWTTNDSSNGDQTSVPTETLSEEGSQEGNLADLRYDSNCDNLPIVGEEWIVASLGHHTHTWSPKHGRKPEMASYRLEGAPAPEPGQYYTVVYRDVWRVAFRAHHPRAPVIIEDMTPEGDHAWLDDILQPGEVWEIIGDHTGVRVWRKVVFPPQEITHVTYAHQLSPNPVAHLIPRTPYRLVKWEDHLRTWECQFTNQWVTEVLTPESDQENQEEGPTARNREINATGDGAAHVEVAAHLKKSNLWKDVKAMVDSGAQGNYISPTTAKRLGLVTREKRNPYTLAMVDGTAIGQGDGKIVTETAPVRMRIGSHEERISLDVAEIGTHQVILGIPWIKRHNPEIDWDADQLDFTRCDCKGSTK
jgi:predicted aspartyl protease